jgi:LPXTG-motif cell wall-anchored protein
MGDCRKWFKCDKFYDGYKSFRDAPIEHGVSSKEYVKRGQLVSKLEKQGISKAKIENYWNLYKLRDGDLKNTNSFETFINNQRLIAQAKEREEAELLKRLKEEERKKEISDSNLFPPKKEDTGSLTNTSTPKTDKKQPNYLLYGGIGLGVLIGAFLIFKKK